jgi:hypothetical protein
VLVFDTSAYLNGWRDHLPPATFPSVWTLIADAMEDGRIVGPREVYNELRRKDDDVSAWAHARASQFTDPTPEVQREAGIILALLPNPGIRDGADPFVVAEAKVRGFTVVTYEGRTFSGVPTRNWARSMPGICAHQSVQCCTLPEALRLLGGLF